MRILTLTPLALLLTGCLAPGQPDPTRYPWDPRNKVAGSVPRPPLVARGAIPRLAMPQRTFVPPEGSFCVMAIEPQAASGIVIGGKAPGIMACSMPANPAPAQPKPRATNPA